MSPNRHLQKGKKRKARCNTITRSTKKYCKKPEEDKQNPEKIDDEIKQVSEFEKKELFDPNNIAALIDKSKEETAEVVKNDNKVTQSQRKSVISSGLTLNEEDALKAQIFGCWSIPLGCLIMKIFL